MTVDEARAKFPSIKPDKQYRRLDNNEILTGEQVLYLLSIANPTMQAIVLLSIWPVEAGEVENG